MMDTMQVHMGTTGHLIRPPDHTHQLLCHITMWVNSFFQKEQGMEHLPKGMTVRSNTPRSSDVGWVTIG